MFKQRVTSRATPTGHLLNFNQEDTLTSCPGPPDLQAEVARAFKDTKGTASRGALLVA